MVADTKADAKPSELRGTLPAGTRLRNYELISVIGHGGFGITYYARDTTLGREVAVKEYLPTTLALREDGTRVVPRSTQFAEDFIWGRERFLAEARILATLEGVPSIVRVYDFLEANGTAYMIMALARGETLEQRVKREKQLPAAVIERLFDRLLGGLEEVHKAGFLHRDVKPANIILDAKDNPTLIDFGASRAAMADRTAALTAIFTPRYAAAEQLTSDKQGPWTDIYSVSATLYHAITGHPPPSSLERAMNDGYQPLSGRSLAGFSPGTLRCIDAGMALRAKHRPQSIADWREILSAAEAPRGDATVLAAKTRPGPAAATLAFRAPPPSPPAPAEPAPQARPAQPVGTRPSSKFAGAGKNRVALYAATAALILVLAGGGYLVLATQQPAPPAPVHDQQADDARAAAAKAQAERQQADEEAARQKAAAEAQARADAEAKARAEAEAKARAEAEAKAEAEARQKAADAYAAQQLPGLEAAGMQKAADEFKQAMEAEARAKAEAEVRHKAEAEAWLKSEAEAMKRAAAEAKQKAEAEAAARQAAETAETALQLAPRDRQRIQVALTSLGFDTHGTDGVFGPRSREMLQAWQRARNQPATGFLTAAQQEALLKEAPPASAR